ncbi:hypothetical protein [Microseira wollei]|uniref:Two-component sensor histidine kinase n=1 Tax=Microseira wollei NIES-4236 TaxID=2530354 RepID=A0AAV3XE66_9CYAN|nr:hypothetical protein [Microseira wollei]GET38662.1 two-component sensor histidine kinase [Microseira wollei NIES-4236]
MQNFKTDSAITWHNLLEEKIGSSEAKMRAVLEAMTDLVLIVNTTSSELESLEIIPTNLIVLNQHRADLISQIVEQFFQDRTANTWLDKVRQAIEKQQILQFDYSLSQREEIWFTVRITPISDNSALWVARDISDRKQAEAALQQSELQVIEKAQQLELTVEQLKRSQSQLVLTEKMASLGQVVAGIAHEINNPTSLIYCNIDPATNYAQDLLGLVELYRRNYPQHKSADW